MKRFLCLLAVFTIVFLCGCTGCDVEENPYQANFDLAIASNDPQPCTEIPDLQARNNCYYSLSEASGSEEGCVLIENNPSYKLSCFEKIAVLKDDVGICDAPSLGAEAGDKNDDASSTTPK